MKVIVGLGNPGKEYELTRHNAGYIVLDNYLGDVNWKESHKSLVYEKIVNNEKILFVKPLTFMNNSGDAVYEILNYYKVFVDDLLVIQDDITLPRGKYRIKYESSDGGHNGIKSIINKLKTNKILRLKIGLSKEFDVDTISYVLGKMSKEEIESINQNMDNYSKIIDLFISEGLDKVLMM